MKEILIGIAIAVGGTLITAVLLGIRKFYLAVISMDRRFEKLIAINDVQSDNIIVLKKAWLEVIKALRSHSYAFRELKVNGSATRALEHIGAAENIINACDDKNAEAAMKSKDVPA
jgi:hypothetical protein